MPRFVLPRDVRLVIAAHAERERPIECCGLLVGRDALVTAAVPMRNAAVSETRFRLDDREHIELRRTLRLATPPLRILGVYHSHPRGPARPSARDVAEAFYPDWLYVVAGLADGHVRVRGFLPAAGGRMRPVRMAFVGAP